MKKRTPSLAEITQVFDQLADDPTLVYGFTNDGCNCRAYLAGMALKDKGYDIGKVWIFGERGQLLKFEKPENQGDSWGHHVMPSVRVRMPSGKIEKLVIDPALFDGPARVKELLKVLKAKPHQVQQTLWVGIPEGDHGQRSFAYKESIDKETPFKCEDFLSVHREDYKDHIRHVFKTESRKILRATQRLDKKTTPQALVNSTHNHNFMSRKTNGRTWQATDYSEASQQKYHAQKLADYQQN